MLNTCHIVFFFYKCLIIQKILQTLFIFPLLFGYFPFILTIIITYIFVYFVVYKLEYKIIIYLYSKFSYTLVF